MPSGAMDRPQAHGNIGDRSINPGAAWGTEKTCYLTPREDVHHYCTITAPLLHYCVTTAPLLKALLAEALMRGCLLSLQSPPKLAPFENAYLRIRYVLAFLAQL